MDICRVQIGCKWGMCWLLLIACANQLETRSDLLTICPLHEKYAICFDYLLTAMMKARTTFFFSLEMSMATELLNIVQLYALSLLLICYGFSGERLNNLNMLETIKDKSHLTILSTQSAKEEVKAK